MIEQQHQRLYRCPNVFLIPAETLVRFTKRQRLWIGERTSQELGSAGLVIDLEPLTLDELYELESILAWVEKNRKVKIHDRCDYYTRHDRAGKAATSSLTANS